MRKMKLVDKSHFQELEHTWFCDTRIREHTTNPHGATNSSQTGIIFYHGDYNTWDHQHVDSITSLTRIFGFDSHSPSRGDSSDTGTELAFNRILWGRNFLPTQDQGRASILTSTILFTNRQSMEIAGIYGTVRATWHRICPGLPVSLLQISMSLKKAISL